MDAIRVILGSKKTVMLREPKIRDQEAAMQIASTRAKDSPLLMVTMAQTELLKILLVQVDGKALNRTDAEQLDTLFSLSEYNQLIQVVGQLSGGRDLGEFQVEHATFGGKSAGSPDTQA